MRNHACIIIFAKAPIKGHVKTRLAKNMEGSVVVNLYRQFVLDLLDKINKTGRPVKIFYDPPGAQPLMVDWLGDQHDFFLQTGPDLGHRMANAFSDVFKQGIGRAILIGTDFPDLPDKILTDALLSLEKHDAVIGPAVDGGYYLIGFCADSFLPSVFKDMPWGTPDVYQKTMSVFQSSGKKVFRLPEWRDIDDYNDLINFIESLKKHPSEAKNTYLFLEHIGMIKK
ncbi:MAG: glycosyltransferase [Desulfobacteraceae bacterium]|nr:TIGR04282 family arsenosugar biosynthesis glycosyltransferase [Desulfobacteraceae bacterium]MBC2755693.1 glycosyltransferase [Desulfobacteraceae bacterium]